MKPIEVVVLMDKSGSMQPVAKDAIGGFNQFLIDQKSVPGEANLSLVFFDSTVRPFIESKNIHEIDLLTENDYIPRGPTALYDAIGLTMNSLGNRADGVPKIIFAILTDGEENASRYFIQKQIANMIEHQREKYSWEFIFLAANQDAFTTGASLNIGAGMTRSYVADSEGTQSAYSAISELVTRARM